MQIKKVTYIVILLWMMTMLVSCGIENRELNESKNIVPTEYEKSIKDVSDIVKNGFFTLAVWKDYIVINEKDNKENYTYHYINRTTWEEEKRIEIGADEERGHVVGVSIDDIGNIYMLRVDTHTADGQKTAIYVLKYFIDKKAYVEQDVTDLITQVKWDGDAISGLVSIMAINDNRLAVIMDYQVIVLDDELKQAEYILSDNKIVAAAKMKDGNIICVSENENGTLFCKLDVSKKKWGDSVNVVNGWLSGGDSAVLNGGGYDFYYRNSKGIVGIDWKDRRYTQVIDYKDVDLDWEGEEDKYMLPLADSIMITQNMKNCITSGKAELQVYMSK